MSSELLVRVVIVVAVVAAALLVALGLPRLRAFRAERVQLDLTGLSGDVLLFTSRSCPNCERLRLLLASERAAVVELVYEDHTDVWAGWGVEAVPLLVVRGAAGNVDATVAGSASRRRLRRALAGAGK